MPKGKGAIAYTMNATVWLLYKHLDVSNGEPPVYFKSKTGKP